MKDLTKKAAMAACSLAFLGLAAGQAQAISITVTQIDNTQAAVDAAIGDGTVLEDFEGLTPGWYGQGEGTYANVLDDDLDTAVGEFYAIGENGTGSTSYAAQNGLPIEDYFTNPALQNFEVRNYDANGRYDVTDVEGDEYTNYLDTADITVLLLDVEGAFDNLFFFVTDPSDIRAVTSTGALASTGEVALGDDINPLQDNGSLWFVEIDGEGDTIDAVAWAATTGIGIDQDITFVTNDGFGIDNIGTRVPEPGTALLLGAGLLPLVGLRRRSKK